jgi:hypothetical protein
VRGCCPRRRYQLIDCARREFLSCQPYPPC